MVGGLLGWFLFSPVAFAQGKGANLAGVTKDVSEGVIAGAKITVRHPDTGKIRLAESDSQGRYAFPDLEIGRHEITAEFAGFQPARAAVELSVGQKADVDLTLIPAGVSERVDVRAGEAQLTVETRTATFGQLVSRSQIANLPLNGRDFSQLILLQPVVVQARSDQGDVLTGKGPKVSVHGARTSQNAYMLDGTDILDALGRSASSAQGLVSGIESVQEFTVLTNTYGAEYGRAAGGVFNIATRSGTNQLHGSLFEYLRNSALDARNFFDAGKPPFRRNQFGGSAGGPMVRNKAFFFGAYEGFRERLSLTELEFVPSLAARRGAFLPAGQTVQPAVEPYLALIPRPTIDDPGEKATYTGQFRQPSNLDTYNARADWHYSQRGSAFVRYTQNDSGITFLNPETFSGFPNRGENNQKFLSAGHTQVASPSVVNSFTFALNRTTPNEAPSPVNPFPELAFAPGEQIVGTINISGFKRFGSDRNTPRTFFQDTYQFMDHVSVVRGPHWLKMGANAQHFRIFGNSASRNRGEFTIDTFSDFLRGRSRDFVGLDPKENDTIRNHRQWLAGFYLQDDWKVHPRLTLNLGLRYEFITVPTERDGKITNVRTPTDPAPTVGGPLFRNPSKKNFAPRFGFAYSPGAKDGPLARLTGGPGKTSIRGGFGIYYEPLLYATYGNMTFKHSPYFKQIRIAGAPFPNVAPLLASGVGQIDTFAIDFNAQSTYVMQFNLNVQREIASRVLVTAGYVGSRGIHLWREADFNNAIPLTPDGTRFPTAGTPRRRNPNFSNIRFKVPDAQSFYNAFQLAAHTRLRSGLHTQVSYTFAKSVDDGSSSLGRTEFANGQARTVDPYNKKLNRGLSDFDARQSLSANFSYDLPFGRQGSGPVRWLMEGWQVNGIVSAVSGIPVSPIFTFDQDRDATTDNEQRPNLKPGITRIPRPGRVRLFDAAAFDVPALGSRGTLGRNTISGPGLVSVDPSVAKFIHLDRDRGRSVQFRAEFFNALNRANFAILTVANLTVFNSPTQVNTTAGQFTRTSTTGRQIQLSLRVSY